MRRLLLLALLAATLIACGSAKVVETYEQSVQRRLAARGLAPGSIELPFALDDEMRRWARVQVAENGSEPSALADELLTALLSRSGLHLVYQSGHTGTAREVFTTKTANCLAFTHLFVGMARELGLAVYYLRVDDLQRFDREGDLVIASGHVTAGFGPPQQRRILEFSELPIRDYKQIRQIDDLEAVAMFYSNRGAELLRQGDEPGALPWLEIAVRIDPELPQAWVNLGVAQRRAGQMPRAEASYRRALDANPETLAAYQNLSALLQIQRRGEEAAALLALTDRKSNRNPFSYLALGDLALHEKRRAEAERYYRRALRLDPQSAEPLAAMGAWALAGDEVRDAKRWLRRAQKIDAADERVTALAANLERRARH